MDRSVQVRIQKTVQVKCPCCQQRLFDMDKSTDGIISIKCGRCKAVVSISMHHTKYKCTEYRSTEQIAARA